jgi:hypothetical protein
MKAMTYGDLLSHLQTLDPHELAMNVTIHMGDVDDFVPVHLFWINSGENDVLDEGHPYIVSVSELEK